MNETLLSIALTMQRGLSLSAALALVRTYGSAAAVYAHIDALPPRARQALSQSSEARERAESELNYCRRNGIEVLPLTSNRYPTRLRECPDPPLALFFRGNADLNTRHILAVVGTRRITEYGKDLCRNVIADLAQAHPEVLIVSGLAYGVDIHAHRAALQGAMSTVGVLAHGLDRIYPPPHRATAVEMLGHGGLLTEYPSLTRPDRGNFIRRNRIIAGMADATLVVESADHGGALVTARLAQEYNRDVFAFPGRIADCYSAGCNALIARNTAALVTSATDLCEKLGWQESRPKTLIQRELFPELAPDEAAIIETLEGDTGEAVDRIAVLTNIPVYRVTAILFDLEMRGIVCAMAGGRFRRIR